MAPKHRKTNGELVLALISHQKERYETTFVTEGGESVWRADIPDFQGESEDDAA